MYNPTPYHPMEADGPMDGRRHTSDSSPIWRPAAHRTLEIPEGFPQASTGATPLGFMMV